MHIEPPCSPDGSEMEECKPEVFENPFALYEAAQATATCLGCIALLSLFGMLDMRTLFCNEL